MYSQIMPD
jgi:dTMP kinase